MKGGIGTLDDLKLKKIRAFVLLLDIFVLISGNSLCQNYCVHLILFWIAHLQDSFLRICLTADAVRYCMAQLRHCGE